MQTLIVGGGNMGQSYAQSFLDAHILRRSDIAILEKSDSQKEKLRQKEWTNLHSSPGDFIANAELIIIAVKPQDSGELMAKIQPYIKRHHVILSIMAGVKMQAVASGLDTNKIIRAMPNLPAQIGMGMTAFTALDEVTREELTSVQNLLNTTGKAIYFTDEKMLDAATAVSGSGPAYVYYFMDAMMKKAIDLGFSEAQADLLVWQTFNGAVHLQNKAHLSYADWIKRVSSKGGTTEAAIKTFGANDLDSIIQKGLQAAMDRAVELGE